MFSWQQNKKRKAKSFKFTSQKKVSPDRFKFHSMIKEGKYTCNKLLHIINNHLQSISAKDNNGYYPLLYTCMKPGYEARAFELLEMYPNAMNKRSQFDDAPNPLHCAIRIGCYDTTKSLLNDYPWLNEKNGGWEIGKPYHYACKHDRANIVKNIIEEKNMDVNETSPYAYWTPLYHYEMKIN